MKTLSKLTQLLLVALLVLLVVVGLTTGIEILEIHTVVMNFFGEEKKSDALGLVGVCIGGVLLALNALVAHRRTEASLSAAEAQAEAAKQHVKANEHTGRGQLQERLRHAIEHLGRPAPAVRLGGVYELFHLAHDARELGQTVLDILCAHIRHTTDQVKYREQFASKPSSEIQSILTLLFVRAYPVFHGLPIDLQGSWLRGVDLREARLHKADLKGADLSSSNLCDARLERATLTETILKEARLERACLQEADFTLAEMQGCNLSHARLQGATFLGASLAITRFVCAQLQGADLCDAEMCGATLSHAKMQGARLSRTYLQGATLGGADFRGASSTTWSDEDAFVDRINKSIGVESDFSETIGAGNMVKGGVERQTDGVVDENKREALRSILMQHIGRPLTVIVPEERGVVVGCFSAKEAAVMISKHERHVL